MFAPKSKRYRPPWGLANEIRVLDEFAEINHARRARQLESTRIKDWLKFSIDYTVSRDTDINDDAMMITLYILAATNRLEDIKPYLDIGCVSASNIQHAISEDIDPELAYSMERG